MLSLLFLPCIISAQTFKFNDLRYFWGIIELENKMVEGIYRQTIFEKRFVDWGLSKEDSSQRFNPEWQRAKRLSFTEHSKLVGTLHPNVFDKYQPVKTLKLPSENLWLLIFDDLNDGEQRSNILVFAEIKNKTVSIQSIFPDILQEFIGGISFVDSYFSKDKAHQFIVINSSGIDGGDIWGKYLVYKYFPPHDLLLIKSLPFGTSTNIKSVITNAKLIFTKRKLSLKIEKTTSDYESNTMKKTNIKDSTIFYDLD